jgi:hypothetical protein
MLIHFSQCGLISLPPLIIVFGKEVERGEMGMSRGLDRPTPSSLLLGHLHRQPGGVIEGEVLVVCLVGEP